MSKTDEINAVSRFLQTRFALPLLIVGVVLIALLSEVTYRRAQATLVSGINLTDTRIGAARLLQLLTDAETAQRGYLLTGNPAYIDPLRNAQKEFNRSIAFLDFISDLGGSGPKDAENIRTSVKNKFAELDRTITLAQSGDRTRALALVQTDSGKQLMDEIRGIFKTKLGEAELLQHSARQHIYTTLFFNRLAVLALCAVLSLGLYLHMRQLRIFERSRVTYQASLEKEVAEKTLELKTLAAWLETAREDEKAHLARELHDELGGILTAVKLTMANIRSKLAGHNDALLLVHKANQHLSEGIALKRQIIEGLRPSTLSVLGLKVALETLCNEVVQRPGVVITLDIDEIKIKVDAEIALFRVAQEALINTGKYAAATEILVRLKKEDDGVRLQIVDNGSGFEVGTAEAGHHGLAGMRFRMEIHGGTVFVVSSPQNGTRIIAKLPLSAGLGPSLAQDDSVPASGPQTPRAAKLKIPGSA